MGGTYIIYTQHLSILNTFYPLFIDDVCTCTLGLFSHVQLFAILGTVAGQASLSIGFSRQEYWTGLQFPLLGDLPKSGIKPVSLMSPSLADRLFTASTTWEALTGDTRALSSERPHPLPKDSSSGLRSPALPSSCTHRAQTIQPC